MTEFKFEENRQPWETGPHWELKREFMEKYNDMFQEDRLLCLAQAYSNIVLMNCSYPEPLMRQISLLADPLQMRKRFQEKSDNLSAETSQNMQKRGKMKLLYQNSGRPFKQIKFCASEDQVKVEVKVNNNFNQNSHTYSSIPTKKVAELQPEHVLTLNVKNENNSEKISDNDKFNELKNTQNISDDKSLYIVDILGMDFIQNLIQKVRIFQVKLVSALPSIISAAQSLKIDKFIEFEFILEPGCSPHSPIYCCKFKIKNCLISAEKASSKKKAKSKTAEVAIDVLTNICNQIHVKNIDKYCGIEPTSKNNENHSTIVNDSFRENNSSDILTVPTKLGTSQVYQNMNYLKESDLNKTSQENMNRLQNLASFVANKTPNLTTLHTAAESLKMENCIFIQKILHEDPISIHETYEWKCFFKDILISCVKCKSNKEGETKIIKCVFDKLRNLSSYKIENGELKELESGSNSKVDVKSESKNINFPFILNKSLFNSSIKDSFVLVNNLAHKMVPLKNFKNMLSETASFCRKTLAYDFEVFHEIFPMQVKAQVLIGNVVVGNGMASSKEEAKTIACNNAVEMLRKKYYTIQLKTSNSDNCTIFRDQVFTDDFSSSGALNESNIGCKMLKNMGWTGGGLGTCGISEPIEINTHHGFGIGLGYKQGDNYKIFKKRMNSILMDFSQSNSFSDLIFSKEFSKNERKDIHQIAAKYGLHTVSRGVDAERFLIVRRKYNAQEILVYLEKVGGSNSKFELIDASVDTLNPFKIADSV